MRLSQSGIDGDITRIWSVINDAGRIVATGSLELCQRVLANPPKERPTMNAHSPPPVPIAVRIEQYVKLRDKTRAIKDRHKEELKPYDAALEQLEGIILAHLDQAGADSVAAKGIGTAYKTVRKSATIADADAFRRHVIGAQDFDLCDWRANPAAVEEFIRANHAPPPGVNFNTIVQIGVRRG